MTTGRGDDISGLPGHFEITFEYRLIPVNEKQAVFAFIANMNASPRKI